MRTKVVSLSTKTHAETVNGGDATNPFATVIDFCRVAHEKFGDRVVLRTYDSFCVGKLLNIG